MNDYLAFIDKRYYQNNKGYHINSDTVLLGMFLGNVTKKSVLDIGTHGGALLLYAQAKGATTLIGIDIDEEAISLAKKNCSEAVFYLQDIKDFRHKEVDVIVCNPPFYQDSKRQSVILEKAMNESFMPLFILFGRCRSLLKKNGSFYLIFPANRFNELLSCAFENDFSLASSRLVYDKNKEQAIRILCQFKRGLTSQTRFLSPITIVDGKIQWP